MSFRRITRVETGFQELEVWRSAKRCEFRVAGAVHAWWHRQRFLTGLAWDNLAAGALLRKDGPPKSLLMLGLAGGTSLRILRHLLPDCRFTAVDIDREMVELAREHMDLDGCVGNVHIADAYEWAARRRSAFDVVVDDCYLAGEEDVFRPERNPERGISSLLHMVKPGGLFLSNLVTGPGHRRIQSVTRAAFKRHFGVVRSVTTPDSMNETLVGGAGTLTAAALDGWTDCFGEAKDREYWRRIEVRKLQ